MSQPGPIAAPAGSSAKSKGGGSIALLDPLRAFAAWAVVAWHSSDLFGYRMPVFSSAAWAVDLFMNISGFLMLFHFLEREEREPWTEVRTWRNFYVRRWFRIAPAYYVSLALAVGGRYADRITGNVWRKCECERTISGARPAESGDRPNRVSKRLRPVDYSSVRRSPVPCLPDWLPRVLARRLLLRVGWSRR